MLRKLHGDLEGDLDHASKSPYCPCRLRGDAVYDSGYTAIFGVSRAVDMCADTALNQAAGTPIAWPKSVVRTWV